MRLFVSSLSNNGGVIPPITRDFRSMTFNIWEGFQTPPKSTAIDAHVDRVDADFISIEEMGGQAGIDYVTTNYASRGYTNIYYNAVNTYEPMFISKIPFEYTAVMTTVDWDRQPLYVEMLIDGKLIGVTTVHLDSQCGGVPCHSNDWENIPPEEPASQRRNIQLLQIADWLNNRKIAQPNLHAFIIQGDYNLIYNEANVETYSSSIGESYLPFGLGYPLQNKQVPFVQFAYSDDAIELLLSEAIDGRDNTWWQRPEQPNPGGSDVPIKLDYISHSTGLNCLGSEILNSEADNTMTGGLEKYGNQLSYDDGPTASDHIAVFADFKIL